MFHLSFQSVEDRRADEQVSEGHDDERQRPYVPTLHRHFKQNRKKKYYFQIEIIDTRLMDMGRESLTDAMM